MGIMITYHGYNNGHNSPVFNVCKMWVHIIHVKGQYTCVCVHMCMCDIHAVMPHLMTGIRFFEMHH